MTRTRPTLRALTVAATLVLGALFVTTDVAARMWAGFIASWLLWLIVATLTVFAVWAERACHSYKHERRAYPEPADLAEWRDQHWRNGGAA